MENLHTRTFVMGPEAIGIKSTNLLIVEFVLNIPRPKIGVEQARSDRSTTGL